MIKAVLSSLSLVIAVGDVVGVEVGASVSVGISGIKMGANGAGGSDGGSSAGGSVRSGDGHPKGESQKPKLGHAMGSPCIAHEPFVGIIGCPKQRSKSRISPHISCGLPGHGTLKQRNVGVAVVLIHIP